MRIEHICPWNAVEWYKPRHKSAGTAQRYGFVTSKLELTIDASVDCAFTLLVSWTEFKHKINKTQFVLSIRTIKHSNIKGRVTTLQVLVPALPPQLPKPGQQRKGHGKCATKKIRAVNTLPLPPITHFDPSSASRGNARGHPPAAEALSPSCRPKTQESGRERSRVQFQGCGVTGKGWMRGGGSGEKVDDFSAFIVINPQSRKNNSHLPEPLRVAASHARPQLQISWSRAEY